MELTAYERHPQEHLHRTWLSTLHGAQYSSESSHIVYIIFHTLYTNTRFLSLVRSLIHALTLSLRVTAPHSSWLTVEKTLMGIFFIITSRFARETSAPSPFLANSLGHSGRFLCTNFITIYLHTMSDSEGRHRSASSRHRHSHTSDTLNNLKFETLKSRFIVVLQFSVFIFYIKIIALS